MKAFGGSYICPKCETGFPTARGCGVRTSPAPNAATGCCARVPAITGNCRKKTGVSGAWWTSL
jgi:hypothetical protein